MLILRNDGGIGTILNRLSDACLTNIMTALFSKCLLGIRQLDLNALKQIDCISMSKMLRIV